MNSPGYTVRAAVREASGILNAAGYMTERISKPVNFFDIIAWKPPFTLFVIVHSLKKDTHQDGFREFVSAAVQTPASGCPGEVQMWINRSPGWDRWVISPGGAIPIDQWDPAVRGGIA